ncbi:sensor domain-containing diguanylate cyclase [Comamonas aquatica]|jgi:diguanylate cyclase (GGDEF)-like protein|uniref:sensor domain-containing diguanylate cyclase n=2 Tax=Comamonas aquatica TaxID=225991 RepID=UPI00244D72C0|nr:sensor domain-containing diguanylate cyclase [Comamonas aquatica]MDH0201690.1 sensor domain-containing diguanylate cyclase [Comamonas aquatica]MDH1814800.1 sensor domain-containing diguanylate cyclase [Comamonas aquatica]
MFQVAVLDKNNCSVDLRKLILMLSIVSGLVIVVSAFYAAYSVQRQQLIQASLANNYVYADKLAKTTDDFLGSAQQQLMFSAAVLSGKLHDKPTLASEVDRIRLQTDSFNSVLIVDVTTEVLATSPEALQITGLKLSTPGVLESIRQRAPFISNPYVSTAGNLLIFISHPIFSGNGDYLGFVAGTVYLKKKSALHRLLGEHYHKDGSYIYVVDQNRRLIYHPNAARLGETVDNNPLIDRLVQGDEGESIIVNSEGVEMLTGFAIARKTGWGVVAQRPMRAALAPLDHLMQQVVYKTLPAVILCFVVIVWSAKKISMPLRMLADGAQRMNDDGTEKNIQNVKSWYFEAQELKKAMLLGVGLLHGNIRKLREDLHKDPLTGLGNRRRLDAALQKFKSLQMDFSVLSIDIDYFKTVNDTHGHDVGDMVLQHLAQFLSHICRVDDVPCRVGGEEFIILLPGTHKLDAAKIAERLRQNVEATDIPVVGKITISVGISCYPEDARDVFAVFKHSDEMLYQAKRHGRNRVEVFQRKSAHAQTPV